MKRMAEYFIFFLTVFLLNKCDVKVQNNLNLNNIFFSKAVSFQNNCQYDSAIKYFKKGLNHDISDTVCIKSLIQLCLTYWWIDLNDSADLFFNKIKKSYNYIKDKPKLLAYYYLIEGVYLKDKMEYNRSKEVLKNALKLQLSLVPQDDTSLIIFYNKLGNTGFFLNTLDSSIEYYKKAIQTARKKSNPNNNDVLNNMVNLALMYFHQNKIELLKNCLSQCELLNKQNPHPDTFLLTSIYPHYNSFYYELEEYEKAFHYQTLASEVLSKYPERYAYQLYEIYLEKSQFAASLKQFEDAQMNLDKAEDIFKKYKQQGNLDVGYLCYFKGIIYLKQDKFEEAVKMFELFINQSKKMSFFLPDAYVSCAHCYSKLKLYYKSIELLNKELKFLNSVIIDNTSIVENMRKYSIIYAYSQLAFANEELSDFRNAQLNIHKGLKMAVQYFGKENSSYLNMCNIQGGFYLKTGNYQKAIYTYENVIQSSAKVYLTALPSESFHAYSNDILITATEGKALAQYKLAKVSKNKEKYSENLKNSLSTYEFLIELSDKQRKRTKFENDKLFLGEAFDSIFSNSISIASRLYRITNDSIYLFKTLNLSDCKKAYVISDKLNDNRLKKAGNIPDSLLKKEKKLTKDITYLKECIYEGSLTEREKSSGTEKLISLANKLDNLISKFENEYPDYYRLKYKTRSVNIPLLFYLVGKKKSIVEYSLTADSLIEFVISDGKMQLISQPKSGIEDSIIMFRNHLSKIDDFAFSEQGIKHYTSDAYWLYRKLIKPVEPFIHSRQIVIIPDGIINLLPFESLVTSDSVPNQTDYGLLSYLVLKYSFSYAYSADLYTIQQQMESPVSNGLLAYAPDYNNIYYNRIGLNSGKNNLIILSPLVGSKEETKRITKTFGGKSVTGNKATETSFKQHSEDGKILHLAMHTIVDNEYPMYSKLVFSPLKDTSNDGYLNTFEIYELNLKTPLVVLSACNTGFGKLLKGEGIISLSRGFMYAGCPSMVITLWSIADRSSSELMQKFYYNLENNISIDQSLQKAKIDYLRNSDQRFSHPYYWAGFIETGKTTPVLKAKRINHFLWWGSGILLILCSGLLIYMRIFYKRNKN